MEKKQLKDVEYTQVFGGPNGGLWFRSEDEKRMVIGEIATWTDAEKKKAALAIPMRVAPAELIFEAMMDRAGIETDVVSDLEEATRGLRVSQTKDSEAMFAAFEAAMQQQKSELLLRVDGPTEEELLAKLQPKPVNFTVGEASVYCPRPEMPAGEASRLMAWLIRTDAGVRDSVSGAGLAANGLAAALEKDGKALFEKEGAA